MDGAVLGRSLEASLPAFAAATGAALEFEPECGDAKVTVLLRRAPAGEALTHVAAHLGFQWRRPRGAAPGRYRLTQDAARSRLAETLRQAAEERRTERVLRRLELAIRALGADPEEMRRITSEDRMIADWVGTAPFIRGRIRLAAELPPAQRRVLAAGGRCVSRPLSEMDPAVAQLALTTAGLQRSGRDPSTLRIQFTRGDVDGGDALMFHVLGPDGRPVGSGGGVTPGRGGRRDATGSVIRSATSPARNPRDPKLDGILLLRNAKGEPLALPAGLPALLQALSRETGLNVVADHYDGQSMRFDNDPLNRRPAWQLLNIIADQYGAVWERRGNYLFFRNAEWYELEAEEIPERLLRDWRATTPAGARVGPAAFLAAVAALREPQLRGLPHQFRGARVEPPFRWATALGTLTAAQRDALLRGEPVGARALTPAGRAALAEVLRVPPAAVTQDPAAGFHANATESQIALSAAAGGQQGRHFFSLPPRGPLLPAVQVTRSPA